MVTFIILVLGVLILSGFFSGAEAALLSITSAEVEAMIHSGRWGARALAILHRNINRAVIAIVMMNNVVNIIGSVAVGRAVVNLYGDAMLGIATTALTFAVIVFSEIIPKSIGIHYAHRLAIPVSVPILTLTTILLPFIVVLEFITDFFKRGERKIGTEEQIRSLVSIGRRSGHIESDEGQLIHRAFILNDKTASDIMTPLKDMVDLQDDMTMHQAMLHISKTPHSRFPVFGTSIHDFKGLVMAKDVLEQVAHDKHGAPVTSIMREGIVVPPSLPLDDLLVLYRDKQTHLAVVQEEDHTVGIVTLEDLIEELVGDIEDETDSEQ